MAVFGNFKGTTKSDFQIGKNGNKISTGSQPTTDISNGDLFIDSSSSELQIYSNAWVGIGDTLTSLNVDNGTLIVDSANDTVSVGSAASNEKLFVNGNLRLGTNPSLQHSGAYLDLRHANGSTSQIRIRDNGSNADPIFKVFNANNISEVFKIQGNEVIYSDDVKAKFGNSGDLEIYHDGNNSYIDDSGTGSLRIRSGTTTISNAAGSKTSVIFNSGGSQDLYHNNSKKFETTNSGILVTGTVDVNSAYTLPTSDGSADQVLTTDGSGTLSFATVNANPDGANTDVQFNDGGSFNGLDSFTFDKATSTLKTGIVQAVIFEHITDYGSVAETANMTMSFGSVTESAEKLNYEYIKEISGPTSDEYKVSNLPDASVVGQMIYVGDETDGAVMAFSDGSNWRRITDRAIVS